MVSRPELGSDPPFRSGRESGSDKGYVECHLIHACSFFFPMVGQHVCTDWWGVALVGFISTGH